MTQKQQIILEHLNGVSNREIARQLHMSKDTVNKYVKEYDEKKAEFALLNPHSDQRLIVIDEVGFVPLHKEAAELLFQVVSESYERKSLIITSNLEFSQWNTVFGDNRLTAALIDSLIDRLIHHSHIVIFSGESWHLSQSMKRQKLNT